MVQPLRVVILKPSKYTADGSVERFRWGFMPNSTVPYVRSMTPAEVAGVPVETHAVDEYVHTDLGYLSLLRGRRGVRTLVALVGVQSHQFHRALDLAAYARRHGCMAVIGGPHVMTCDTSLVHDRGVSFALAEAELVWPEVLRDAARGDLRPVYGRGQRWQQDLDAPVVVPPARRDLRRYVTPMLGLYPARGCPFLCTFCSVTRIAGRQIRSQPVATTLASLRLAKAAGVQKIMFTSDNFNKYPQAEELLTAMAGERLGLEFFVQCDTQIGRQERLVELLAAAGCFSVFVGAESFDRETLLEAAKGQNRPDAYREIVRLCRAHGISSHFSNIIGFPRQTEAGVHEHLAALRALGPTWASFYILCPIPGTAQYDDFRARGLITEANLDRFDTTCLTWSHPHLSREQLAGLLYHCYRAFHSWGHAARAAVDRRFRRGRVLADVAESLGTSLFTRYCAWRRTHPMSGGVVRVRRDGAKDFLPLRREVYGFELSPLPQSLDLPTGVGRLGEVTRPPAPGGLAPSAQRVRRALVTDPVPSGGITT